MKHLETADVMDVELAYLYSDGEFWHFRINETFEQIAADSKAICGDNLKCVVEKQCFTITLLDVFQLPCSPPQFVELEIVFFFFFVFYKKLIPV